MNTLGRQVPIETLDDENPGHVQDWWHFTPYHRAVENGVMLRFETDGNGKLVEIVEGTTDGKLYGSHEKKWARLREAAPPALRDTRRHSKAHAAVREVRFRAIMRELSFTDEMTTNDLCRELAMTYNQTDNSIRLLEARGFVERCGRRWNDVGGPAQILWRSTGKKLPPSGHQGGWNIHHETGSKYRDLVLACLKKRGEVCVADIYEECGVPKKKARQWLRKLIVAGKAKEMPPRKGWPTYWQYTGA